PLLVGDMPFGSYQASAEDALRNAARFLKEAGMDAVKVEGGTEVVDTVRTLTANGIAVMAHVGLTPQRVAQLGGFKVQAKTARAARRLIDDALALEDAGAFSIVLESVPAPVATLATERLDIPTIGIGAGLGMGAIGHVMARALEGHPKVDLVRIDRTAAPLRADEPPVDVAIVATKTPGTEWAANVAGKLLANDGVALTIQNGLGNYETLAEHVGHERAAVGVIYVGAQLVDGELRATGPGTLELGRPSGEKPRANLEELAMLLAEGGMEVRLVDDPWPSVWRKLVTNAAVNPLTALVGKTNADLLADP